MTIDAVQYARLRWRCRRGFLENDLILERFLNLRGEAISADEHAQLSALLELDDNDLWDIIAGRSDDYPAGSRAMVDTLRAVRGNQWQPAPSADHTQ